MFPNILKKIDIFLRLVIMTETSLTKDVCLKTNKNAGYSRKYDDLIMQVNEYLDT